MPTRSAPRPGSATQDDPVTTIERFLDRFDEPDAVDRWRGWASAANAAADLRNRGWRDAAGDAALQRWEQFQSTHGNL
jgi:hypothetical protein